MAITLPLLLAVIMPTSAFALSEIKREEMPGGAPAEQNPATEEGTGGVPAPEPIQKTPLPAVNTPGAGEQQPAAPEETLPDGEAPEEATPGDADSDGEAAEEGQPTRPNPDAPVPAIEYDLSKLPEPTRRMRDLLLEAAKTGDLEKLRPLIGGGDSGTQLSLGGVDGDPVQFLKELSGDGEGQEILAILEEVLSAGYVHLDAGKPEELYVWPYFFAVPLDDLTPAQRVELFKIVTAGDYEDMKSYGAYIFYRVGISPEGHWAFFVAGD